MHPTNFAQGNINFGPPSDLDESQCGTIRAFLGKAHGGSMDGCDIVVTAWQPSAEDIAAIQRGEPIFLTCIGGLPPHFLSTDFRTATHPA